MFVWSAFSYLRYMKKIVFILSVAMVALTGCTTCIEGIGDKTEESRVLLEFTEIESNVSFDVALAQAGAGNRPYALVYAQENVLPHIKTEVNRGKLSITVDECIKPTEPIRVTVVTSDLNTISLRGSGNMTANTYIMFPDLDVDNRGSGNVYLKLAGKAIRINNTGSGEIVVEGQVETAGIDSRGSGQIDTQRLRSEHAKVDSRGSGEVWLQVHGSLDVKLSGSGNVIYRGNPQDIKQSNKGSGNIRRAS